MTDIQPTKYHQLYEGKSNNAHLISFDNGKQYIVKFFKEGQDKVLFNEWVGYSIARYLQLPVPPSRFVQIPESFYSELTGGQFVKVTNTQFAIEYIPNCQNAHDLTSPNVINRSQLAGIIIMDYWLYNLDRTRKNVLFKETPEGNHMLYIIDHADLFGSYAWDSSNLSTYCRKLMKSATHELIASFIPDEKDFYDQLSIIQSIPIHLLNEIVAFTPEDWGVTEDDKKRVVDYLVCRRDMVLSKLIRDFIKSRYRQLHSKS
ncbi:HipA family kinase [Fredinandcohnia onubensis]|uniref:HipA family kinase n=1 Tax=Fredinandcohnia onubensis TaxID=1571209 RepID=UPI0031834ADB